MWDKPLADGVHEQQLLLDADGELGSDLPNGVHRPINSRRLSNVASDGGRIEAV